MDNADDEDLLFRATDNVRGVAEYLPQSEDGLTLFTTRYRRMAVSLAGREVVDLEKMTDKEGEIFLRTRSHKTICCRTQQSRPSYSVS